MQALKALVVVMGLLIMASLALLAYGLVTRLSEGTDGPGRLGEVSLPLPAGCAIAEARSQEGRLILRIDGPAERDCQQVVVIDLSDGRVLGRVTAAPGP
ncbi:MAG: hypothetical protein ACE5GS_16495 [Kiloniellaceae bacterium]